MKHDISSKLDALKQEVERSQFNNEADKEHINALINDIEQSSDEHDSEPVIDNIKTSIEKFEAEHPRATAILNDIMVTLNNMGI